MSAFRYLANAAFACLLLLPSGIASMGSQVPLSNYSPRLREVECPMTFILDKVECSVLNVPIDWQDPASSTVEISVTRSAAKQHENRRGTIFFAPATSYVDKNSLMSPTLLLLGREMQEITGGAYDIVMWSPRSEAYSGEICGATNCFLDLADKVSFYNTTIREDFHREPRWNERMEWEDRPNTNDSREILHAQKKLVSRCIANMDTAELRNIGTAATVRDMAALADILDGPESPINLWTQHHGSVIASYLMKLYPERVGKIVITDPVDPVAYTEDKSHLRWLTDLASANKTLAVFKERLGKGSSAGFQPSSKDRFVDNYLFEESIEYLRSELVGWRTRDEEELRQARSGIITNPGSVDNKKYRLLRRHFPRQSKMFNVFRASRRVSYLGLGAMPLVCGDSFEEYSAADASVYADLDRHLANNIHSAALIATSVFPTLQYLCSLWPIRATERTSLRSPYYKTDLSENLLLLFHPKDTWNYFAMPETAVGAVWPGAKVVSDLNFGDHPFNHDHCGADLMADFFLGPGNVRNTTIPCDQRV